MQIEKMFHKTTDNILQENQDHERQRLKKCPRVEDTKEAQLLHEILN